MAQAPLVPFRIHPTALPNDTTACLGDCCPTMLLTMEYVSLIIAERFCHGYLVNSGCMDNTRNDGDFNEKIYATPTPSLCHIDG